MGALAPGGFWGKVGEITKAALFGGEAGSSAFGMLAGISPRGEPPRRGTREWLEAVNERPLLRRCINKIGWAVASTTWRLGIPGKQVTGQRRARDLTLQRCADWRERKSILARYKRAGELQEITDHPGLDTIRNANPYMTGSAARWLTQAWLETVGDGFWVKERNRLGAVIRSWPVPPTWIAETPSPANPNFKVSFRGWNGDIPVSEMIWFRHPDVTNPYTRGSGTARSLSDNLDLEEYATKYTRYWFFNRARPDFLVFPEGEGESWDEDEIKDLKDTFEKHHGGGFWNAFKPFFIGHKIGIKEMSHTFEEQELLGLRKHEAELVRQHWGFAPEIFGELASGSDRTAQDHAAHHMAIYITIPQLELWRETMQQQLIEEYDDRLVLWYDSPVQRDKDFFLKLIQAAPWAATVDEVRDAGDLEPKDDGSGRVHMLPAAYYPVERLDDDALMLGFGNLPMLPAAEPSADTDDDTSDDGGGDDEADEDATLEDAADDAGDGETADEKRRRALAPHTAQRGVIRAKSTSADFEFATQEIAARLERRVQRQFMQLWGGIAANDEVRRGFRTALRSHNTAAAENAIPWKRIEQALKVMHSSTLRTAFDAGGENAASSVSSATGRSLTFDSRDPRAMKWLRQNEARITKGLLDKAREGVRTLIVSGVQRDVLSADQVTRLLLGEGATRGALGIHGKQADRLLSLHKKWTEDGMSGDKLERRLRRQGDALLKKRANDVADTEPSTYANAGQQVLWEQAMAAGDLPRAKWRKRPVTSMNDAVDVVVCEPMPYMTENEDVHIDESFTTGKGERAMGPGYHTHCKCGVELYAVG